MFRTRTYQSRFPHLSTTVNNPNGPNSAGSTPTMEEIFGATSGYYPVTLANTFTDTAATIPCTADGDLVAAWTPTIGSLPMLTQTTAGNRPLLKADGDFWYLSFDGVDDLMTSASTHTVNSEHFIAMALERAGQAPDGILSVGTATSSAHRLVGVSTGQRIEGTFRFSGGTLYRAISLTDDFPVATRAVASSLLKADLVDIKKDKSVRRSVAAVAAEIINSNIGIVPATATKVWGIAVHKADSVSNAEQNVIIKSLAALQGRTI